MKLSRLAATSLIAGYGIACALAQPSAAQRAPQPQILAKPVEKKDAALDQLIGPEARLELVASGFGFTEGVTWVQNRRTGFLLFSDIPANVIYRWSPDGRIAVHVEKSGYQKPDTWRVGMEFNNGKQPAEPGFEKFNMIGSNGLALDRQGRLIIATWAGRTIERLERSGAWTVIADRFEGKRFNGPNDVIVRKDGTIYFTDTFGGLLKLDKDPAKEQDRIGVYMIRDGKLARLIDDLAFPNGLALSPDHNTLYVNGGRDRFIRKYTVKTDGTIADMQMLIDLNSEKAPGITDGMKTDAQGNIWTTGPGGVWVITPAGKPLGVVPLPEAGTNLVFGDADRQTLYISARTSIYRLQTKVAGAAVPAGAD